MSTTALITVIYPESLPFLPDLISSVNQQTQQDLTFFLVNDGIANTADLEQLIRVPYQIMPAAGSPLQNRISTLQQLRQLGYKKALFVDADDMLPDNWVAVLVQQLHDYPFVCCDLHLVNAQGSLITPTYWQGRLGKEFEFDQRFLLDKNILGFGNCGLQLRDDLQLSLTHKALPAPDWYFFYINLHQKKALFSGHTHIYYRQHSGNMLGITPLSLSRLQEVTDKKLAHYQLLHQHGHLSEELLKPLQRLKAELRSPDAALKEKINKVIQEEIHYFWWEETNYLI